LGLAERVSHQVWSLTEGWQKLLRDLGERGDIIKQIHHAFMVTPRATESFAQESRSSPADNVSRAGRERGLALERR
jgi:hypothetical protein